MCEAGLSTEERSSIAAMLPQSDQVKVFSIFRKCRALKAGEFLLGSNTIRYNHASLVMAYTTRSSYAEQKEHRLVKIQYFGHVSYTVSCELVIVQ